MVHLTNALICSITQVSMDQRLAFTLILPTESGCLLSLEHMSLMCREMFLYFCAIKVSATMVFVLSVVFDLRSGPMSSQLDEVWRSIYFVLEYLIIGSLGLWMFFRSQNVRLTPPEV